MTVRQLGEAARNVSVQIAEAGSDEKNRLLAMIARLLGEHSGDILLANKKDIEIAKDNNIGGVMVDRLMLNDERIRAMAKSLGDMIMLGDPIGIVEGGSTRPNGLKLIKKRVPLGVIAMIYESRPNVTVDAAALCLKAGNAVILRGGKEAIHSNAALVSVIKEALTASGFSTDIVGLVTDTSRDSAKELMELTGCIDLLIPRGGRDLINAVVQNARVPVIETGAGNCHVYVDRFADLDMAVEIVENAKISRPSVCNAAETLLVHRDVFKEFLPMIFERIGKRVEFRGDGRTREILHGIREATEEDWHTEYNDFILTVGVVDDIAGAVEHINRYGTRNSEAIVTKDVESAEYFLERVDAAAVYLNASTRFTDGGEFGLSAEIGIATGKLHCRGPMGLEALTTTKYILLGSGQIR